MKKGRTEEGTDKLEIGTDERKWGEVDWRQRGELEVKGTVLRDFQPLFLCLKHSIWNLNEQALSKIFDYKVRNSLVRIVNDYKACNVSLSWGNTPFSSTFQNIALDIYAHNSIFFNSLLLESGKGLQNLTYVEYPNKPNCMNNRKTVNLTGKRILQLFLPTILSIAVQIFRLLACS